MSENIYAYTESSTAPYPPYVSINKTDEGVSVAVRSAGDELASEILLPPSVYTHLVAAVRGDTMIEIASAQLKELAAAAQEFAAAAQEFADALGINKEVSVFLFEIGDEVKLALSDERGTVVGRAEYATHTSYLVHYKAGNGCATSAWFDEGYLLADDCANCEALPTDAEIPLEQPAEAA